MKIAGAVVGLLVFFAGAVVAKASEGTAVESVGYILGFLGIAMMVGSAFFLGNRRT